MPPAERTAHASQRCCQITGSEFEGRLSTEDEAQKLRQMLAVSHVSDSADRLTHTFVDSARQYLFAARGDLTPQLRDLGMGQQPYPDVLDRRPATHEAFQSLRDAYEALEENTKQELEGLANAISRAWEALDGSAEI